MVLRRRWCAIVLLLAIAATASAQIAASVSTHSQDHASHCCAVCHAGHVSVLQPADYFGFVPPTQLCWHQAPEIV